MLTLYGILLLPERRLDDGSDKKRHNSHTYEESEAPYIRKEKCGYLNYAADQEYTGSDKDRNIIIYPLLNDIPDQGGYHRNDAQSYPDIGYEQSGEKVSDAKSCAHQINQYLQCDKRFKEQVQSVIYPALYLIEITADKHPCYLYGKEGEIIGQRRSCEDQLSEPALTDDPGGK